MAGTQLHVRPHFSHRIQYKNRINPKIAIIKNKPKMNIIIAETTLCAASVTARVKIEARIAPILPKIIEPANLHRHLFKALLEKKGTINKIITIKSKTAAMIAITVIIVAIFVIKPK